MASREALLGAQIAIGGAEEQMSSTNEEKSRHRFYLIRYVCKCGGGCGANVQGYRLASYYSVWLFSVFSVLFFFYIQIASPEVWSDMSAKKKKASAYKFILRSPNLNLVWQ